MVAVDHFKRRVADIAAALGEEPAWVNPARMADKNKTFSVIDPLRDSAFRKALARKSILHFALNHDSPVLRCFRCFDVKGHRRAVSRESV